MSRYVSDTHALHWHMVSNPKLSPTARQLFQEADAGMHQIVVPAIVLIEFVYLEEKGRLDRQRVDQLFALLNTPGGELCDCGARHSGCRCAAPGSACPGAGDAGSPDYGDGTSFPTPTHHAR